MTPNDLDCIKKTWLSMTNNKRSEIVRYIYNNILNMHDLEFNSLPDDIQYRIRNWRHAFIFLCVNDTGRTTIRRGRNDLMNENNNVCKSPIEIYFEYKYPHMNQQNKWWTSGLFIKCRIMMLMLIPKSRKNGHIAYVNNKI